MFGRSEIMSESKKIEVLFISGLFPKEIEEDVMNNSLGNIQNAANGLQWKITEGLNEHLKEDLHIINSMYIGSYPRFYKKIAINKFYFNENISNNNNYINIGFVNLPLYKQYSRYKNLKTEVMNWINNGSNKNKIVIAYAMTITFTKIIKFIKQSNTDIKTCLIVPDLPQFMNVNGNKLYDIVKGIEITQINHDLKYIDKYVFLTEHMGDFLNIKKKSIVIEGISNKVEPNTSVQSKKNIIFYSGGIEDEYGVFDLVFDFMKAEKNQEWELIICGSGSKANKLKELVDDIKNIKYLGLLSREIVIEMQKEAAFLINPRNNSNDFVKYSFPSKTLEYMSSGTPLIGFKLDGIPTEYYNFMFLIDDFNGSIQNTLENAFMMPFTQRTEVGLNAKRFVESEKNSSAQTKKILEFLKE